MKRYGGVTCEKYCQVSLGARCLRENWPWHDKVKDGGNGYQIRKNYVKMVYIYLYCDASGMAHP
jgi:hypothetical protein